MSREVEDWLEGYLLFTENSEPQRSYHTWCGLSVLAGALQRKVHLQWGFEVIYPNMFMVLVGPSGRARKGVALGIAKEMISSVPGVSVAPEAASREAIILAMKRAGTNFQDAEDNKIKYHCSLTAFSEELSVLLGQNDIKLLSNLTDWYDSKAEWAYETIGRGRDALQGLCFNLAGATAPEWIQSMLPQEAIGGGFTSRVLFIVEDRKRQTVPKHQLTPEELDLKDALQRDLARISQLSGQMTFDDAGEKAYTEWYSEQDALLANGHPAVDDSRFAGYCERRATHIRKMMLMLSASRSDDLKLTQADFDRARGILVAAEAKMPKTFGGLGKAPHSDATEQVLNYIKQMGITTRSVLMSKFYRDVDPFTLKGIEETMMNMKVVQVKLLDGNEKVYTWIGGKS